ncbi:hypothetical protein K502DRAFT_328504 [Neoconidiobolus thromboides FSU 785]|nr:hypothetical protein K502DRAFT_328504 [Neoconidiobolus thromboides FSU 785]
MNYKLLVLTTIFLFLKPSSSLSIQRRQNVNKVTNQDGSVTTTTTDADGGERWITESPTRLGSVSRSGPIPLPGVRQLANLFGVSNQRFDQLINQAAQPIMEASDRDLNNRIQAALAN